MQVWSDGIRQASERNDDEKLQQLLQHAPTLDIDSHQVSAEEATHRLTEQLFMNDLPVVKCITPALQPMNLVFYPNSIYVVAGKPGSFKSALVEQVVLDVTDQGSFVLDISVEVNETTRTQRYHQHIGGVDFSPAAYNEFTFDPARLEEVVNRFSYLPGSGNDIPRRLIIDARSSSLADVLASMRLWLHTVREHQASLKAQGLPHNFGPPIIVVDFLQIVAVAGGNIYDKLNAVVEAFYEFAKREDISMIWVSQLRKADKQQDPGTMPTVEDLEGSERIRQLAHHILILHRPLGAWTAGDWHKLVVNAPKVRTGQIYMLEAAVNGKTLTVNADPTFLAGLAKTRPSGR
jgi:replicative DNA helicase